MAGRLTNALYADNFSVSSTYDWRGVLYTASDSTGQQWLFNYAQLGTRYERASVSVGRVGGSTFQQLWLRQFDDYGRLTNSVDRNGVITAQTYDLLDRLATRQSFGYSGAEFTDIESFAYSAAGLALFLAGNMGNRPQWFFSARTILEENARVREEGLSCCGTYPIVLERRASYGTP